MKVLGKSEAQRSKEWIHKNIRDGAVFIYPTDTIYGIGCDATNEGAVKKIRELKKRPTMPFSVIAPSKEWIKESCLIPDKAREWLDKLPGPYTFVFKTKGSCVAGQVNPEINTLGVRMPKHWFAEILFGIDIPIVTTSVNRAGEQYLTRLEDLDVDLKNGVDFAVSDGPINGKPSTVVVFDKDSITLKER